MQFLTEIIENKQVAPGYYFMKLSAPEVACRALPGQFLHVRVNTGTYPLLRRPLSLHEIDSKHGSVSLLYQVRGAGTELLSQKTAGEKIDVMGPLGKGFNLDFSGEEAVLVGGGIGIAPLYPLAGGLISSGKSVTVLIGSRSVESVLAVDKFSAIGCRVRVSTNDGTEGLKGYVTELFEDYLMKTDVDYVYACGPGPMLAEIEKSCAKRQIPGQVSLEEYMGCGVGACLSCACEKEGTDEKKYLKVCTDGPVFTMGEVKLNREP
ncbi:MAG: dihydroorotate dehydrogenase electron transfer subunit [Desulfitobacteriaceae bacterium]|nr:dihydroorotate dehydrogenase electron transfer subunit [Desulfitobacteriaceae bacterium]